MGIFPRCTKCGGTIEGIRHLCLIPVGKLCPRCHIELPKTGVCDNCD
jgi:hypothetical protein